MYKWMMNLDFIYIKYFYFRYLFTKVYHFLSVINTIYIII